MDVVLGVAVTRPVARLAMIGSPSGEIFDEYALDLPDDDATTDLAETIVGTYRAVTESGNRLAATRLFFPDAAEADTLRQVLLSAGVEDVEVVSEADAATALVRSTDGNAAVLLVDDEAATLTTVDPDSMKTSVLASVPIGAAGAAVACAAVLDGMRGQPEAPVRVMLVSHRDDLESVAAGIQNSPVPVDLPTDASFAIARGAAQTAAWAAVDPAGPATQLAPASAATQLAPVTSASDAQTGLAAAAGPQLAYSMADPDPAEYGDAPYEMPMDPLNELIPEQDPDATEYTEAVQPARQRMLLMGSAIAFVVVSFATLAVTVAINVRPAADVSDLASPPVQSDTVPGRYLPPVPHEPDPVAQPVAVLTPPPAAPSVPVPNVSPRTNNGPVIGNVPAAPPAAPAPEVPPPPPGDAPLLPPPPQFNFPYIPLPPIVIFPPGNQPNPPSTPPSTPPVHAAVDPAVDAAVDATLHAAVDTSLDAAVVGALVAAVLTAAVHPVHGAVTAAVDRAAGAAAGNRGAARPGLRPARGGAGTRTSPRRSCSGCGTCSGAAGSGRPGAAGDSGAGDDGAGAAVTDTPNARL